MDVLLVNVVKGRDIDLLKISKKIDSINLAEKNTFTDEENNMCKINISKFIHNKLIYIPIKFIGTSEILGWVCMKKEKNSVVETLEVIASVKKLRRIYHDYINILNLFKNFKFLSDDALKKSIEDLSTRYN